MAGYGWFCSSLFIRLLTSNLCFAVKSKLAENKEDGKNKTNK